MPQVEILGPKGPLQHGGVDLLTWARSQIRVAGEIVDNPGGGLLFASQTIGQVRAALAESGEPRWTPLLELLEQAEDAAVHRDFQRARAALAQAGEVLEAATG
ncbi:MAG TPA: hypothetical protein VFD01_18705 [Candidatus Dormibacteraeota bacterium]|jgi:hypothetical protein|nr:hypothetical protein [Candidatus Dormibacteraeota bacterium]